MAGAVSVVPQLWRLARHRDEDSSGVSVATAALSLVSSLCWVAHGLALGLPAVVLPGLASVLAAAWTLTLLRPATAPRRVRDHRHQPLPVVLPMRRVLAA